MPACPAFLVAAPASGQGKTTVVAALARLHTRLGRRVRVFKCGPDFLDPQIHAIASGAPCQNVDLWMCGENDIAWRLAEAARDVEVAEKAWDIARQYLADPEYGLVVLDEFTYVLKYGWLNIDRVLETLAIRPPMQHVIITGRAAPDALVEAADTVTDMTMVKHAFKGGVKAMPGLEW